MMRCTLSTPYWTETGDVTKQQYGDGSLALVFTVAGEPWATLSVNLIVSVGRAPDGHIYVKNEGESTGLVAALEAAGIAKSTGTIVEYGNFGTTATLMEVTF
jgi:hypothetical protein